LQSHPKLLGQWRSCYGEFTLTLFSSTIADVSVFKIWALFTREIRNIFSYPFLLPRSYCIRITHVGLRKPANHSIVGRISSNEDMPNGRHQFEYNNCLTLMFTKPIRDILNDCVKHEYKHVYSVVGLYIGVTRCIGSIHWSINSAWYSYFWRMNIEFHCNLFRIP